MVHSAYKQSMGKGWWVLLMSQAKNVGPVLRPWLIKFVWSGIAANEVPFAIMLKERS